MTQSKNRKGKNLQAHHIDASVFLLFLSSEKHLNKEERLNKKSCREYLKSKLRRFYKGVVSIPSLGEITKTIMEKDLFTETVKEEETFQDLLLLMKGENIGFWFPQIKALKISEKLIKEYRLEAADALHLACAYEDIECNTFVTLDTKLVGNNYLEKRLDIKIKTPMQL